MWVWFMIEFSWVASKKFLYITRFIYLILIECESTISMSFFYLSHKLQRDKKERPSTKRNIVETELPNSSLTRQYLMRQVVEAE